MADFNMSRNAEGYYDETPYNAVLKNTVYAKAGEIWKSNQGKEFLVLKNHGKMCNVLLLNDVQHEDNLEVMSRKVMYTNPVMVSYIFTEYLVEFVKALPEEDFAQIVHAVVDKLELNVVVSTSSPIMEETKRVMQDALERVEIQKKELESLRRAVEAKTVQIEGLSTRLGLVEEEKEDFRALFEKKDRELAAASVYKEEYHALLDSLLHGGKMQ